MARDFVDEVSIVIAGQAGQGIQSIEYLLTHVLKLHGYNVFASKEYMSRIRGGMNSTEVRVSSTQKGAFVERIDFFIPLDPRAIAHCEDRLDDNTIIFGESAKLKTDRAVIDAPLLQIAHDVGNRVYANTVAAGVMLGVMQADMEIAENYLRTFFARKGEDIVQNNITALQRGYKIGQRAALTENIDVSITKDESVKDDIFLSGSEAVGFGALAGGCNFISSYPMSPSTGVLTFLAQHGKECGVVVEQATDELGAVNMVLGATFAGARSMTTTSGGGFALMTESVSLAAITETPLVVHVAQRPGPATGLPTRTAQEDLNLVLHAGHGEFPRVILAPGTVTQAYDLTAHALEIAHKYQTQVFILTDQYFVDALSTVEPGCLGEKDNSNHIVTTQTKYKRYALGADDGVSPRGVPGNGEGFVHADSDEHTEDGRITEDFDVRAAMTEKRFYKKRAALYCIALEPTWMGKKSAKTLIVSWGSNKHVVEEALEHVDGNNSEKTSVHFAQLFPLPKKTLTAMKKADKIVVVENNEAGQFADLLEKEGDFVVTKRLTQSTGKPFSVEQLAEEFKGI